MHQVFLGVTKSLFTDCINEWLKSSRLYSLYVATINPLLLSIKDLSLDYCKAETVSVNGGFGRYVSENYLAFARLCKWVYGSLNVQNDQIELLISTFLSMVSRIMVTGEISESVAADTDRHIKLFLTAFHNFQKSVLTSTANRPSGSVPPATTSGGNKPFWLSKYNYITLLNIPECMLRYGSLRLLFEGDGKGEGSLRYLKEAIASFRGKWAFNAATKYYLKRAVREVLTTSLASVNSRDPTMETNEIRNLLQVSAELVRGSANDIDQATSERPDMHCSSKRFRMNATYANRQDIVDHLSNGRPVSVVIIPDGHACVLKGGGYVLLRIGAYVQTACNAAYFEWQVDPDVVTSEAGTGLADMVVSYGLLLPLKTTSVESIKCFYLLTSNWEELRQNGCIAKPQVQGGVYP